jgi:cell division septum initiation protein DivIVA
MTTELTPQFAVTVRGYDRAQVDDYVDTLRNWHGNATARMQAAETEAAQLREQVVRLRQRVADLEQQTSQEPPRTITALGDRVTRILQLAEEAASETRAEAEAEAKMIVAKSQDEAEAIAAATRARQAEVEAFLTSATEQAQQAVEHAEERASEAAAHLTAEAETKASQREADAEHRSQMILAAAEADRVKVAEDITAQRSKAETELRDLQVQRDEMRAGLLQLRESLHRTLGQLPTGSAGPAPVETREAEPSSGSAEGQKGGETVLFDHEAVDGSGPADPPSEGRS